MFSSSKTVTLQFQIYFKVASEKAYLLLKSKSDSWQCPTFTLNLSQSSQAVITNKTYQLLEKHFAIARSEIKSLQVEPSTTQTTLIKLEINEEAVIVLSDKYLDYTWGNEREGGLN